MTVIGEAFVRIRPDDQGFEGDAENKVTSAVKKIALAAGGVFAAQKIFSFGSAAIAAAEESRKITAQTEQVIKSTGGAAKVTADQIGDLATAISNKTGIDDEAIQSGSNLLLTFTNIRNEAGKGNDIFNQATGILTDMSAALGTDVSGSAVQLGKALNDPVKGVAALSRVGVTFTEDQKKVIKSLVDTGDTAGAQKVILAELGKEFGGSAEAQASASDKLKVTLGNLQEEIGKKLLPIVDKVAGFLAENLIPAFEQGAKWAGTFGGWIADLGEKLTPVGNFIKDNVVPVLAGLGAVILSVIVPAFIGWAAAAIPAAIATVAAAAPAIALAAALGVLVGGLVYAYTHFETFHDVVQGVVGFLTDTVMPVIAEVAGWIVDKIGVAVGFVVDNWPKIQAVIQTVLGVIQGIVSTVLGVITGLWQTFGDNILRVVGIAWGYIRDSIQNAIDVIRGIINVVLGLITGDWGRVWDGLKGIVGGLLGQVANVIRTSLGLIKEALVGMIEGAIAGVTGLGPKMLRLAGDMIGGLVQGIKDKAGDVISAIKDFVLDKVPGFVKKFFGIGSPSKLMAGFGENVMEGFIVGLRNMAGEVDAALSDALPTPDANINVNSLGATPPGVVALQPSLLIQQTFGPGTNAADVEAAMRDVARQEVEDSLGRVVERATAGVGRV